MTKINTVYSLAHKMWMANNCSHDSEKNKIQNTQAHNKEYKHSEK